MPTIIELFGISTLMISGCIVYYNYKTISAGNNSPAVRHSSLPDNFEMASFYRSSKLCHVASEKYSLREHT